VEYFNIIEENKEEELKTGDNADNIGGKDKDKDGIRKEKEKIN